MHILKSFYQPKLKTFFTRTSYLVLAQSLLLVAVITALPHTTSAATLTAAPRVSFTFDDGLDSAVSLAQPTLAKYGFTATDYIITGCVGMTTVPNTCKADPNYAYMTWAQIAQLKAAGWEVGSHSVTHPLLASTDPTDQPVALTPAQVAQELSGSKSTLSANGYNATDFASPYGDWTPPILAQIAQTYASHRGFADIGYNSFPYNDYLLYDQEVQAGVSVATVESYINTAKANNQWLVLTFHHIMPGATASVNPDDYQYNQTDLDTIAAYVKSQAIQVVNVGDGLAGSAGNLLPNSSFDAALSSNTADTASWSTDSPSTIKQDAGSHGNYPSPVNSVSLTGSAAATHLFSPQVPITGTKRYVLKNYLNVTKMTVAAGHEIGFYIDEYDANGTYLQTQYKKSEVGNAGRTDGGWVEDLNFEYVPTSATVAKARLQLVVTANSGAQAYLDNTQWFAEDGSTTGVGAVGKAGDVNGDNAVNALDLSIMLSNWNKSGVTRAQGDLSGDGAVNALDLSMLLTNWNK